MDRRFATRKARGRLARLVALTGCGLLAIGCSNLQVPAIDPSGRSVFSGNSTSLSGCLFPTPTPAFQPAPELPWCPDPAAGVPVAVAPAPVSTSHVDPRSNQQLSITPVQVVAPVGSEVVLKAGLCGADGLLASRERLEWILEPGSAGHFVEVGDDDCDAADFFSSERRSRKVDAGYALGRTTGTQDVLTRGTPNPSDDIALKNGEGWISVSSPNEGVSRVTALASESEQWDKRQQTSNIYWIDANWTFPPPGGNSAGRPHVLQTYLRRATTGAPLANWLVRYEVVGGAPAGFGPQRQAGAQVLSDASGLAAAELVPADATSGTTQVLVSIVRPASPDGTTAEIAVAQAVTTVSWSSPNLTIGVTGPNEVQAGQPFDIQIVVGNPGDVAARATSLAFAIPGGVEVLSSQPAARPFGERVEWALGDLAPGGSQIVRVNCRANLGGEVRNCFVATSQDGLQAQDCLATRVQAQSLAVRIDGPRQVAVGSEAAFQISVTNQSDVEVRSVEVVDRFGPGLRHKQGQVSPLRVPPQLIGPFGPRETKQVPLTFIVLAEGEQCHDVQVLGEGGQAASARACVVGTPAPIAAVPRLAIDVQGPTTARVGSEADFLILIRNTGDVALTDVRIVDTIEASLAPLQASDGYQALAGGGFWVIPRIEAGQSERVRLLCRADAVDPDARQTIEVTSREGASERREFVTVISPTPPDAPGSSLGPPPILPPTNGGLAPTTPRPSGITTTFTDQADPIRVGEVQTYLLSLKNEGAVAEEDVVVRIEFPTGLRYEGTTSSPVQPNSIGADAIEYAPFLMPAGDALAPFRIRATALAPGPQEVRVTIFTRSDRVGKVAAETTTVSP